MGSLTGWVSTVTKAWGRLPWVRSRRLKRSSGSGLACCQLYTQAHGAPVTEGTGRTLTHSITHGVFVLPRSPRVRQHRDKNALGGPGIILIQKIWPLDSSSWARTALRDPSFPPFFSHWGSGCTVGQPLQLSLIPHVFSHGPCP